jgi:hypothetical protein
LLFSEVVELLRRHLFSLKYRHLLASRLRTLRTFLLVHFLLSCCLEVVDLEVELSLRRIEGGVVLSAVDRSLLEIGRKGALAQDFLLFLLGRYLPLLRLLDRDPEQVVDVAFLIGVVLVLCSHLLGLGVESRHERRPLRLRVFLSPHALSVHGKFLKLVSHEID